LLQRIKKSGSYKSTSGGTQIYVPLNYATASASGWFSGADTLSTVDSENITSAAYDWTNLYAGVTISEEDELKNSGDAAQLNLLKSKMQIAEKTIADSLGTGLYSDGSNAESIVGLRDIVAVDQTVGGIDQSTYSWWQGQVDSTTSTNTLSAMNAVYQNCTVDSEHPDYIVASRAVYNTYYDLLTPVQRFVDESIAKGGFESLKQLEDDHSEITHWAA